MSITIKWRPVTQGQHFNGTSDQFEIVNKHIGTTLTSEDIPILRAMRAASGEEFYDEVIDAVDTYDRIEIWAVY